MMIAIKYHETGEQLVSDSVRQISQELSSMVEEINRLEYYLSLLPENLSDVIRLFFFEGVQNARIAEQLGISQPTMVNRKNAAVVLMSPMSLSCMLVNILPSPIATILACRLMSSSNIFLSEIS